MRVNLLISLACAVCGILGLPVAAQAGHLEVTAQGIVWVQEEGGRQVRKPVAMDGPVRDHVAHLGVLYVTQRRPELRVYYIDEEAHRVILRRLPVSGSVSLLSLSEGTLLAECIDGTVLRFDVSTPERPRLIGGTRPEGMGSGPPSLHPEVLLARVRAAEKYGHGRREVAAGTFFLIASLPLLIGAAASFREPFLQIGFWPAGTVAFATGSTLLIDGLVRMHRARRMAEAATGPLRLALPVDAQPFRSERAVGYTLIGLGSSMTLAGALLLGRHGSFTDISLGVAFMPVGSVLAVLGASLLVDASLRQRWSRQRAGLSAAISPTGASVQLSLAL